MFFATSVEQDYYGYMSIDSICLLIQSSWFITKYRFSYDYRNRAWDGI